MPRKQGELLRLDGCNDLGRKNFRSRGYDRCPVCHSEEILYRLRGKRLVSRRLWIVAVFLLVAAAYGQSGFRPALPGYEFQFPRDHGSHDEYRTEWWYYTGQVTTAGGKRYGFEVTFFRVGVLPPPAPETGTWDLRNLSLAHFAISDLGRGEFRYYEKMNRETPFLADARTGSLDVFNEGWSARTTQSGDMRLLAAAGGDRIELVLKSRKPPAIHGTNGVSVKAAGEGYASHYYSLTRLAAAGSITVGGRTEPCSGLAWMDHEFGSSELREHQQGWDWFSLQLDNGTELMLYQIRKRDGIPDVTSSGSVVQPDGNVIHLTNRDFVVTPLSRWKSSRSGATYPMGWRIDVKPLRISLAVREEMRDQELITKGSTRVTYWEGAVRASGSFGETPVTGAGYVEMTGYDKRFGVR